MTEEAAPSLFEGQLRGTVARVLFENRDSGWAVVHLEPESGGLITVVGPLAPVFPGASLEIQGEFEEDRRYGRQFRASVSLPVEPDSEHGTRRYLASGVVPGIGPGLARRLVERFGAETLKVLDEEPERLLAISGIGPKRLEMIRAGWKERSAERRARVFLQGHGLGPAMAERIIRAWGEETVTRVREDPYELVGEVRGVGFRTADGLAQRMGIEAEAEPRLRAGLTHLLWQAADDGNCYLGREVLIRQAARLLEIDDPLTLDGAIDRMVVNRAVIVEADGEGGERVWHPWIHAAERRVARRLAMLRYAGGDEETESGLVTRTIRQVESNLGLALADEQREALEHALVRRLLVVTGGPGTGKTTLIDALVRCADILGLEVALAAPTGRAAKRMEQATGRVAKTVHRLLEFRFGEGFGRGEENPIEADLIVVDEFSMVDLGLMDALVAATRSGARLLFVGDADQLPPVGPGAVLRDLIVSGQLPTVRLRHVFRQARASQIIVNAHRVNAGELPLAPEREEEADFYLVGESDPDRARELVLRMVTERIPRRFGLDPRRDIQVLAPMRRGRCGVGRLNADLQDALNPGSAPARVDAPTLRPGDRVMQLRNDYDREVFNGDIGSVELADPEEGVTVEFDGRSIGYDRNAMSDLALAYATTVHKSQGSEYAAVVVVLLPEHHIMLQRNLLYTALTRARQVAVLVSGPGPLRKAVENAAPAARNTALAERLREAFGSATGAI